MKFFYRLFPSMRPWEDYKTSEVLQLVLDNFKASDQNVFLCNIAGEFSLKLIPVVHGVLKEHGISTSGNWISFNVDFKYLGELQCWDDSVMLRNTARVVFLQMAIEKYKKMGD